MPLTPAERADLAVTQVIPLIPLLELGIAPDGSRRPPSLVPAPPRGGSRPPWSPAHAFALTALISESLTLYAHLRHLALHVPHSSPSPSLPDRLRQIPLYLELPQVPPPHQDEAARITCRWLSGAQVALGIEEAWVRVPRPPASREARCPYCQLPSLRMRVLRGEVRCIAPQCRDLDRQRPRARATQVPVPGTRAAWTWQLWWQDGTEGLAPRHPQQEAGAGAGAGAQDGR